MPADVITICTLKCYYSHRKGNNIPQKTKPMTSFPQITLNQDIRSNSKVNQSPTWNNFAWSSLFKTLTKQSTINGRLHIMHYIIHWSNISIYNDGKHYDLMKGLSGGRA